MNDELEILKMITGQNGRLFWNEETNRWEDEEGNVGYLHKRLCKKCNKPRLDINGVEDCDFCLQGLSVCSFIDFACCGHGDDSSAYISLKDSYVRYGRFKQILEELLGETE